MIDIKLILEALKLVKGKTPYRNINIAMGSNEYPNNLKEVVKVLKYRYG